MDHAPPHLKIPKRVTAFGARVYHPLVKHESVLFCLLHQFDFLERGISFKLVGVLDGYGSVCRVLQLRQNVLFHRLIIEHLSAADVQGEPTDFALEFAPGGLVPIIFGTPGDKFDDVLPI